MTYRILDREGPAEGSRITTVPNRTWPALNAGADHEFQDRACQSHCPAKKVLRATGIGGAGGLRSAAKKFQRPAGNVGKREWPCVSKRRALVPQAYFRLSSLATRAAASRVRKVLGCPS